MSGPVAPTPDECLAPTFFVDSDHPAVVAWARDRAGQGDAVTRAVRLFDACRDEIRYDPYRVDFGRAGFRASTALLQGRGFCVNKAALLAAGARALGLPARLGFADVRNHLTSPKLWALMGTDVFVYHGYAELWLGERWVKATPAFNTSLCERAGLRPLVWDGRADAIYHPFDAAGRRHMEYVLDRGVARDVPWEHIRQTYREVYGWTWERLEGGRIAGDFEAEARADLAEGGDGSG